uniref:Uncharacterized protein n=1 Tax=Nothobranchius korthausae TaxID=1143690 RepID=A0A1A8FXV9_9TELE
MSGKLKIPKKMRPQTTWPGRKRGSKYTGESDWHPDESDSCVSEAAAHGGYSTLHREEGRRCKQQAAKTDHHSV